MLFKDVNNDLKFSVYQTCVDKHETHNLCPRSLLSMGNRKKKVKHDTGNYNPE